MYNTSKFSCKMLAAGWLTALFVSTNAASVTTQYMPVDTIRATDYTIGMRTLLLVSDVAASEVAQNVLEGRGQDFDVLHLVQKGDIQLNPNTNDYVFNMTAGSYTMELYDATGNPKYNSIIYTNPTTGYNTLDADFNSIYIPHALTHTELAELSAYRAKYNVRAVIFNADEFYSSKVLNAWIPGPNDMAWALLSPGNISFIESDTAYALKSNIAYDFTYPLGFEQRWTHNVTAMSRPFYKANPEDKTIKPFLKVTYTEGEPTWVAHAHSEDPFVGFIHDDPISRVQDMVFSVNMDQYSLFSILLGDIWHTWMNHGIFFGQRRLMLSAQIDDLFMATDLYNVEEDRPRSFEAGDNFSYPHVYRTSAHDLEVAKEHQNIMNDLFNPSNRPALPLEPQGRIQLDKPKLRSNYTLEMAYNGMGYEAFADYHTRIPAELNVSNMNDVTHKLRDDFLWVTHTWSHLDMYCTDSNCTDPGPQYVVDQELQNCYEWTADQPCNYTKGMYGKGDVKSPEYPPSGYSMYELIVLELTRNQYFANFTLFDGPTTPAATNHTPATYTDEEKLQLWNRSPHSIVTPRISGVNYTESIRAMLEHGYRALVGDNTRADLTPTSHYHPFEATALVGEGGKILNDTERQAFNAEMEALHGVSSIFIIPRFASRVYFDVSLPNEIEIEHNSMYGPNCHGWNETGEITFGVRKCNSTSFKFEQNLTMNDILDVEGYEVAGRMLNYRTDPYMFHQANLRAFEHDNRTTCLTCEWAYHAAAWVAGINTFPLLTLTMEDLTTFYHDRMHRDFCGIDGKMTFVNGKPTQITSDGAGCVAKLTVTDTLSDLPKHLHHMQRSEEYGVDTTYDVQTTPGTPTVIRMN